MYSNAINWSLGNFHFEGFTSRGIQFQVGYGATFGYGILNPYVGTVIGIEFQNVSGCQDITINNVRIICTTPVANYNGIQINGSNNVGITVRDCIIQGWGGAGVQDSGSKNKIFNCDIYGCNLGINANGNYYNYKDNIISGTTGSYSITHNAGSIGLWSGNTLDKTINPAVTGLAGNFSGICVKNNTGYVTRSKGQTATAITSGASITHGLVGNPGSVVGSNYYFSSYTSGITSFPYVTSPTSTTFNLNWTGTANVQWTWEVSLPCDF